jgi:hypothetical protein
VDILMFGYFDVQPKTNKMKLKPGDKVIKNEKNWIPNDFDNWGRGIGIGIVVEPPFELENNEVDVRWPAGRCFETVDQLIKVDLADHG